MTVQVTLSAIRIAIIVEEYSICNPLYNGREKLVLFLYGPQHSQVLLQLAILLELIIKV